MSEDGIRSEDGERLEFGGMEKTQTRGTLEYDGVGRYRITSDDPGDVSLRSIMPDSVEMAGESGATKSDELVFWINVTVWKPTGEFRDEE